MPDSQSRMASARGNISKPKYRRCLIHYEPEDNHSGTTHSHSEISSDSEEPSDNWLRDSNYGTRPCLYCTVMFKCSDDPLHSWLARNCLEETRIVRFRSPRRPKFTVNHQKNRRVVKTSQSGGCHQEGRPQRPSGQSNRRVSHLTSWVWVSPASEFRLNLKIKVKVSQVKVTGLDQAAGQI